MDREASKVIPARKLRTGDIVRAGKCPDGCFSQPVWTPYTKYLDLSPDWVRDGYREFENAEDQVFQILHVIPPSWKTYQSYSDKHYDVKFIALSEVGIIVVWMYDWEAFEVLSGD